MPDCTEIEQIIYDMTLALSQREDISSLDDVVAEIRKDFPVMSREYIVEAIVSATARGKRVETILGRIKREARKETSLAKTNAKIDGYLEQGRPSDAPRPPAVPSETVADLRKTRDTLNRWLKTADPDVQRRMQARLDKLNKRIEAGEFYLPKQKQGQLHDSLKALDEAIKQAQKTLRDGRVVEALEATIAELEAHLEAGTLPEKTNRAGRTGTRADQLRDIRDELRKAIGRSAPARKARLEAQLKALDEALESGDIAAETRDVLPRSRELDKLKYEVDRRRNAIRRMRREAAPRTAGQRFRHWMHFFIPIKAGQDFSQVLNQGGRYFFSHPVKSAQALVETLKAMASPVEAARINREMVEHPMMPVFYEAGYRPSEVTGISEGLMEEAYWGSLLERVPIIREFSRGFSTYLNVIRFGSMVNFGENWTLTGQPTLEEAKVIVKGVNQLTGRGTFGKNDSAGPLLDTVMWAPRLVASHVQTLFGFPVFQSAYGKQFSATKYFAAEYGRWIAGVLTFLFLGWLRGWELDLDPTSTNVGGLRKGNVTLNPLGGVSAVLSLVGSHVYGKRTHAITRVQTPLRGGDVPYGGMTLKDLEFNFMDWKVHPAIGSFLNLIRQEKFGKEKGEPVTVQDELLDAVTNITWKEIYEVNAQTDLGVPDAAMASLLALLGMKTIVYTDLDQDKLLEYLARNTYATSGSRDDGARYRSGDPHRGQEQNVAALREAYRKFAGRYPTEADIQKTRRRLNEE